MALTDPFIDPSGSLASGDASMSRIARSGLWSILAHIVAAGSILIVSIIIGRTLGPADLGHYTFHVWMLRVVPTVLALGVPTALTKFVSEKEGAGAIGEAATLFTLVRRFHVIALAAPAAVIAVAVATGDLSLVVGATLLSGICVALLTLDHEALLAGLRRFRDLSLVAAGMGVVQVVAASIGAVLGLGWTGFLALFVLGGLLGLMAMAAMGHRWLAAVPPTEVSKEERRRFRRFAWAVALAVTAEAFLWGRPELIFLDRYRSSTDLGLYSTALRLSSLASMIPLVASRALLPEFSYQQAAGRHAELQRTFRDVCRLLMVATAPMALGGLAVAGGLVTALYGPSFAGAGTASGILLAGSLVNALAGPSAAVVFIGPRPRLVAEVGVGAVALNALLDVLFIPRFGPVGAATINVVVQTASVLIGMAYAWVRLDLRYPVGAALRALALAGLAAGVAMAVQGALPGATGVAMAIVAAGAAYLALIFATGTLRMSELRRLVGKPS